MGSAALALSPALAHADNAAPAGALFRQAREDAARGDYDRACPRFAESLRLTPAAGTMLNLADCEEHRGRLADALEQFQHGLEALPPNDERVAFARERIARLLPRVPHVRLHAGTVSVTADLDGVPLGQAALDVALPVNPGTRTIVVHAPGRSDRAYSVVLAEGATLDVAVEPGNAAPPPSASPSPSPTPAPDGDTRSSRTLAWTALGIGGVGLATSAVTGILALHSASTVRDHCPNHRCTDPGDIDAASTGKTYATASTIGLAVGVIGIGVASYLFLSDRRPSAVIAPMAGPTVAGLSLSSTFH
ncbi:MAG: hypothetical protein QOI41_2288 [Myxococcales bacterium]|nr:hypothetical protein [Myxococcales bacterium]